MDQVSKMYTIVGSLIENNLHTEKRINMSVSRRNGMAEGRLVKIELEAIKVNVELAMIPKTTRPFTVWESSRPWLEWQWKL